MFFSTILHDKLRHRQDKGLVVHSGAPVACLVLLPHEAKIDPQFCVASGTAPDEGLVGLPLGTKVTPVPSRTIHSRSHRSVEIFAAMVNVILKKSRCWPKEYY